MGLLFLTPLVHTFNPIHTAVKQSTRLLAYNTHL